MHTNCLFMTILHFPMKCVAVIFIPHCNYKWHWLLYFCRGLKSSVWSFHPPQPDLNVDFVVMHFFHYKMSCTLVLSKRVSYDIPTDLSVAIKLEEQHQHSNLASANMLFYKLRHARTEKCRQIHETICLLFHSIRSCQSNRIWV